MVVSDHVFLVYLTFQLLVNLKCIFRIIVFLVVMVTIPKAVKMSHSLYILRVNIHYRMKTPFTFYESFFSDNEVSHLFSNFETFSY